MKLTTTLLTNGAIFLNGKMRKVTNGEVDADGLDLQSRQVRLMLSGGTLKVVNDAEPTADHKSAEANQEATDGSAAGDLAADRDAAVQRLVDEHTKAELVEMVAAKGLPTAKKNKHELAALLVE